MKQLCTICLFIGTGRHGLFSGNTYVALAQVSLGIALIAINIDTINTKNPDWSQIIIFIIAAISIFVGVLNYRDAKRPGRICPRCKKPAMLELKSQECQQFIKENNIKIPDSSQEPPK